MTIMTPEQRAKTINLGDCGCYRAAGGICYEHQQIANAIRQHTSDTARNIFDLCASAAREVTFKRGDKPRDVALRAANAIHKLGSMFLSLAEVVNNARGN